MEQPVDLSDFSALPCDRPAAVRPKFQAYFAGSIDAQLDTFEQATGMDVAGIRRDLTALDTTRAWSPELYFCGGSLVRAFRAQSIDAAVDAVARLRVLTQDGAYASPRRIESMFYEPWERYFGAMFLDHPSAEHLAPEHRPAERPILEDSVMDELRAMFGRALSVVRDVAPGIAREYDELVTGVRLFNINAHRVTFTTLDTYGVIFIGISYRPNPELFDELIEGIVHEVAHTRLNTLMYAARFLDNDEQELYSFPSRKDRQPMRLVFHAPFVYARILHVLEKLRERSDCEPYRRRFARVATRYRTSYQEVAKGARMTRVGRHFFESLSQLHGVSVATEGR